MASFRKRNGKWQVQIRKVGAHPLARTFGQKSDAMKWASEQERTIETAELPLADSGQRHTLLDLLVRYERDVLPFKKAPEPERYVLRALMRHPIAQKRLVHLSPIDFAALRDERLKEVKASTFRRQMNVVRHALSTARREWGWAVRLRAISEIAMPTVAHFPVDRLDDVKIGRVLEAASSQANPYIVCVIRLALLTGLRRGELLALRWDDVNLVQQTLTVRTSKNGHPRVLPLYPAATSLLKVLPRAPDATVFPISPNALKLAFQRARTKANLTLRFHDLRHEAISRLFEIGLTIPEVQMLSGHRTLSQLSRYSHPNVKSVAVKLQRALVPT
jgi:integrase